MITINFELMEIVNKNIRRNVFLKSEQIDAEINEFTGCTNLGAMAEFDGGHDLEMVETEMWKQAEHKACLEPFLSQISEDEEMELIMTLC